MECTFSNSKLNIAMPLDALDDIVKAYLRDQVLRFEKDISNLIVLEKLETYQKQDLLDLIDFRDAHLKVLNYLTEHNEHQNWIKKNELGTYVVDF